MEKLYVIQCKMCNTILTDSIQRKSNNIYYIDPTKFILIESVIKCKKCFLPIGMEQESFVQFDRAHIKKYEIDYTVNHNIVEQVENEEIEKLRKFCVYLYNEISALKNKKKQVNKNL